jgi:O-methyltransferase
MQDKSIVAPREYVIGPYAVVPSFFRFVHYAYVALSVPISVFFLFYSSRIHTAYKMNWLKRIRLGLRMFWNSVRLPTGTSYKLHMAMAVKILETAPAVEGVVVECGCWKGGSTANLSLACKIAGRQLHVFDSFEGLPPADPNDREAKNYLAGDFRGRLEEVKGNISKYGALDVCVFHKGWVQDTLPQFSERIVLAFIDVDLEASLDACVRYIWPRLTDGGHLFSDEALETNYVALFYSERWWQENFGRTPPGCIGAGSGLPLGTYYIGPASELPTHPLQHGGTAIYTNKAMSGYWAFYPEKRKN